MNTMETHMQRFKNGPVEKRLRSGRCYSMERTTPDDKCTQATSMISPESIWLRAGTVPKNRGIIKRRELYA